MEPRPYTHFTAALAAASATVARVAILARNGTILDCLGKVKLISTTAKQDHEVLSWATSISGGYASRWFFAQAPEPEDEAQDEPEDEKQEDVESQRKPDPTVRKQTSTEDNAGLLRDGGTINPPFP